MREEDKFREQVRIAWRYCETGLSPHQTSGGTDVFSESESESDLQVQRARDTCSTSMCSEPETASLYGRKHVQNT